jgi:putative ABC transport system permease protein
MLYTHLRLALRQLWRQRFFTGINLLSLSVGLASLVLLHWQWNMIQSFDAFHRDLDRLYLLHENIPGYSQLNTTTVTPALPALLREQPAIETGTRILTRWHWVARDTVELNTSVMYVDAGFFDTFSFPLKQGNARQKLAEPGGVLVAHRTAVRYFGEADPIGKTLRFDDGRAFIVRGVLAKHPVNSTIMPELVLPFSELERIDRPSTDNWYNGICTTYLKLRSGSKPATLEKQLNRFVQTHYAPAARDRTLALFPFGDFFSATRGSMIKIIKWALPAIGLFVLLILLINYLNLTSALSLSRLGEVALRTAIGSSRRQVWGQFVVEALLVAVVGAALGTLLFRAALPSYLSFFQLLEENNTMPLSTLWLLIGVVLLLGFVAGGAPARYLTGIPVVSALQGKGSTRRATPFRQGLIVVQFALAVALVGGTGVMLVQNRFVKQQDLGFAPDNVLIINLDRAYRDPTTASSQFVQLLRDLRADADVVSLSTTAFIPGRFWQPGGNGYRLATAQSNPYQFMRHLDLDSGFVSTMRLRLLEGRNLTAADTLNQAVLINETARHTLGLTAATGKQLAIENGGTITIAGVVADFNTNGLHHAVEPTIFWSTGAPTLPGNNFLSIRTRPGSEARLMAYATARFGRIPARESVHASYLRDAYNQAHWVMERSRQFLTLMASITIFLAVLGVFGLSLFAVRQRTRELGIRKVLGASANELVWLLSRQLLALVAVSAIVATPITYLAMRQWLAQFTVQIAFPWWVLAASGTLALLVTFLTVSFHSVKAARANPVTALRTP